MVALAAQTSIILYLVAIATTWSAGRKVLVSDSKFT